MGSICEGSGGPSARRAIEADEARVRKERVVRSFIVVLKSKLMERLRKVLYRRKTGTLMYMDIIETTPLFILTVYRRLE